VEEVVRVQLVHVLETFDRKNVGFLVAAHQLLLALQVLRAVVFGFDRNPLAFDLQTQLYVCEVLRLERQVLLRVCEHVFELLPVGG